jgi:hypothetical protein
MTSLSYVEKLICRSFTSSFNFKEDLMDKYEMKFNGNLRWFSDIRVLRDRKQKKP